MARQSNAKLSMRLLLWALPFSIVAIGLASASDQLCNTQITWRAPAGCPGKAELIAQLAAEMSAAPADWTQLDVRIEKQPGVFALSWRILSGVPDETGAYPVVTEWRTLAAPSCQVVVKTAATVIALAIDPGDGLGERVPPGPCPQSADSDSPPLQQPSSDVSSSLQAPRGPPLIGLPFDLNVRVMAGADSGTLPNLSPTIYAALGAQFGRWRFELGGSYLSEQRKTLALRTDVGGDISLRVVALRVCADVHRGFITAALCAGGQLGEFHSAGYNLSRQIELTQPYAAADWGVSFARALQEFLYFRLDARFSSPFTRPRFTICETADASTQTCLRPEVLLWQPERILLRVFAGVELVFR